MDCDPNQLRELGQKIVQFLEDRGEWSAAESMRAYFDALHRIACDDVLAFRLPVYKFIHDMEVNHMCRTPLLDKGPF